MATRQVEIAQGNEEQFAAWNGDEGEQWTANPEFYDAAVRNLHRRLMTAADITATDRVLDIGCGTGQCAHEAARRAREGSVLGIDLSLPMIRVAEALARRDGLTNAAFVHGDAQLYPFPPSVFDLALSRTGAMFFANQVAAFGNIARALRPGGRLLMVSWRAARENEWITVLREALLPGAAAPKPAADAPTPFRHADRPRTSAVLQAAGFQAVRFEPLDVPMYLGCDTEEAFPVLSQLFGWMVRDLEPTAVERALERMRAVLHNHETPDGVAFGSASWLITARRPGTPTGARA